MRLDRKKEISRDEKQLADLKQQQKSYEKEAANWGKNKSK